MRGHSDTITVSIPTDAEGYLGRTCPRSDCGRYFKLTPGTGLPNLETTTCPYCGADADSEDFSTPDQVRYAQSVAVRRVEEDLFRVLKASEFDTGPGFLRLSMKASRGTPARLHRYAEEALETKLVCDGCTLRYAVYGVFARCPDCGAHNNLQILNANLDLAEKYIALAEQQPDPSLGAKLIEDALENAVSAFDGWGRGVMAAFSMKATNRRAAESLSFQNLLGALTQLQVLFGFNHNTLLDQQGRDALNRAFQTRHLVAHRLSVADRNLVDRTGSDTAIVGRKVTITAEEVRATALALRRLAAAFIAHVALLP